MAVSLYRTATEYVANALTITRGTVADITSVGVFMTTDPTVVPTVAQFATVTLVKPGDALAEGTTVDVLSLIGPRSTVTALASLTPGDYQRWVKVTTATEDKIRKVDTVTIL